MWATAAVLVAAANALLVVMGAAAVQASGGEAFVTFPHVGLLPIWLLAVLAVDRGLATSTALVVNVATVIYTSRVINHYAVPPLWLYAGTCCQLTLAFTSMVIIMFVWTRRPTKIAHV